MKQTRPLSLDPSELGPLRHWQIEWKWQGEKIRIAIKESGTEITNSDGDPLDLPEIDDGGLDSLPPGTTFEGILIPESPRFIVVWDCLEFLNADLIDMPLYSRQLQAFPMIGSLESPIFRTSEPLEIRSWEMVKATLDLPGPAGTTGLVLKKTDSLYPEESQDETWWTVDFH